MLDPTTEYTLALALEDYVPVVLSIVALLVVAAWASRQVEGAGRAIRTGALLVGVGGLSKATWKLLVVGGTKVDVLDALLFPAIGAGFAFVVVGLLMVRRGAASGAWYRAPLLVTAAAVLAALALGGGAESDAWTTPFLILSVVGSTATAILLASAARRAGDTVAAAAFWLYLVAMFVMAGLAQAPEQTLRLQWIEQSISTAAQATFLVAAWRLRVAADTVVGSTVRVSASQPDPA